MCMFYFIAFSYQWEIVYNRIVFNASWILFWILSQIRDTESVHWWGIISHVRFVFCILSFGWFLGVWILCADVSEHSIFHLHKWWRWWFAYTAYEDWTECSETSAHKIQTPGKHPKERIQHSEHGENLKSKDSYCFVYSYWEPDVCAVEGRCVLNAGKADVSRWTCKLYMVFCLTESGWTFYCLLIGTPFLFYFILFIFFFLRWNQLYENCNSRA